MARLLEKLSEPPTKGVMIAFGLFLLFSGFALMTIVILIVRQATKVITEVRKSLIFLSLTFFYLKPVLMIIFF